MKQAQCGTYYRPSGKVAPHAFAIASLCGVAALPGAVVYAWVCLHAPALVRLLCLGLFGMAIALVVDWTVHSARLRSRAWVDRFGVALAACAWAVHWVCWWALGMPDQRTLAGAVMHAAQYNPWGLPALAMAGAWVAEAWWLLHTAAMFGRQRVRRPFCEASGAWAEEILVPRRFAAIVPFDAIVPVLERAPHRLAAVLGPCLAAPAGAAADYAEVTLYRCGAGDVYVSIANVAVKAGRGAQEWLTALRLPAVTIDALLPALIARADAPAAAHDVCDSPLAPTLASALALYQAARFSDAYERAQPHTVATDKAMRLAANRLCALACVRQGRWDAAVAYWSAVFDDDATAGTALQLAGSAVLAGDVTAGRAWFQRARDLNAASAELAPLTLLTTFVSALDDAGRQAAAMPWMDEIRDCYCTAGVTDPTVLCANRMPLFHEFLDRSAPIVFAALGGAAGLRWFAAMLGHLDDAGHAALRQWIDEQGRTLAG